MIIISSLCSTARNIHKDCVCVLAATRKAGGTYASVADTLALQ